MAYFKFTKSILNKEVINLYTSRHVRDFTYIDDVVDAIYLIIIDKREDYDGIFLILDQINHKI